MKSQIAMGLLWISTALFAGCGFGIRGTQGIPIADNEPVNIVETARADGRFNTLLTALVATGLTETVAQGNFTVFAPTDDAFNALPAGVLNNLLANPAALANILLYHVVAGTVDASQVVASKSLKTANQSRFTVTVSGSGVRINSSNVLITDVRASNGIIHVIDRVLTPPQNLIDTATAAGNFTILLSAINALGLREVLANYPGITVFAPTDQAFGNLPAGTLNALLAEPGLVQLRRIILYHLIGSEVLAENIQNATSRRTLNDLSLLFNVSSAGVLINNTVQVTTANLFLANGGTIHVINNVLLPNP